MKTVIEMAREAGAYEDFAFSSEYFDMSIAALERLVEFARADEREACAELIEAMPCECCWPEDSISIAEDFADAIRARGVASIRSKT